MMSNEEKIEESQKLKEKGTKYFKDNQFEMALKFYNKVVEYLDSSPSMYSAIFGAGKTFEGGKFTFFGLAKNFIEQNF